MHPAIDISPDLKNKLSSYYPYLLEKGRSVHIECSPDGIFNIWDSKIVGSCLTLQEAKKICEKIKEEYDNDSAEDQKAS